MNKKIIIVLIVVIIAVVGLVYFLQQPKTSNNYVNQPLNNGTGAAAENRGITIQNFSFNPAELTVKSGDTVTWTNQDSVPHRISGGSFQSDPLSKGQSFSFTFSTVGTFDYICSIHPSMKGKIIVQ